MSGPISATRRINRMYRRVKTYVLMRRPPVLTRVFCLLLSWLDRRLSGRKQTETERLINILWKQTYLAYWRRPDAPRVFVRTNHPVAFQSDDHRFPRGTVFDNSVNPRFNNRLYELFGYEEPLRLLDLGCAGGGLVRSFLEDGHLAVGLEGSDNSKRHRSGEWDTIPYHLFTCDITKDFAIVNRAGTTFVFDAVTAWEVLEHLDETQVGALIERIARLLRPGGYFIGSIDLLPDGNPLTGAVYHKTLQSRKWWLAQFSSRGFDVTAAHKFEPQDMVRGHGQSFKDWHPADGGGMHVVARRLDTQSI